MMMMNQYIFQGEKKTIVHLLCRSQEKKQSRFPPQYCFYFNRRIYRVFAHPKNKLNEKAPNT